MSCSCSRLPSAYSSVSRTIASATRSYASSSKSSLPLQPAVAAAHEAALEYLSDYQSRCLSQLDRLRSIKNPSPSQRRTIEAYEIAAYVNDPAVRADFRSTRGVGQMDRPVMRHLAERQWKIRGGLDLIMARVYENKVVPDLLPDMGPTNPLTVSIQDSPIEPGVTLESSKMETPPRVTFQLFNHPSEPTSSSNPEALYTLLVLDADHPEPTTHTFSQRLHYLKTNMSLSISSGESDLMSHAGDEVVSWEPPAPAQGSPRHRYVYFLIRQTSKVHFDTPREHFNLRQYLDDRNLSPAAVVGVNIVKSEWTRAENAYVERIYEQYRDMEAPVFSKGRNEGRYAYPLSGKQQRVYEIRKRAWEEAMAAYAPMGLDEAVSDAADGALEDQRRKDLEANAA